MRLNQPIKLPTNLLTMLNLHILGVAVLAVMNIVLATRLVLAWHDLSAGRQDELQQQQTLLAQLRLQNARLEGLPEKVDLSRKQADKFVADRIPASYSSIAAELGDLSAKNSVRLTRAAYTQSPAPAGLAEIRIDANLSGEYPGIMRFINGVERDRLMFVISGIQFTGQQGGMVNLRLRLITYLRAADAGGLPPASPEAGPQPEAAVAPAPGLQPSSQEVQ